MMKKTFMNLFILFISALIVHSYAFFIKKTALSLKEMNHSEYADLIYQATILKTYGKLTYLILGLAVLVFIITFRYSILNRRVFKWLLAFVISFSFMVIELAIYKNYF